jgi:hypothetical protein
VLQGCNKNVTRVLPWRSYRRRLCAMLTCSIGVIKMLSLHYQYIINMFSLCCQHVIITLSIHYQYVLIMLSTCYHYIINTLSICSHYVVNMLSIHYQYIINMFSSCCQHVINMLSKYFQNVTMALTPPPLVRNVDLLQGGHSIGSAMR